VTHTKEYASVIKGCWIGNPALRPLAADVVQQLQTLQRSLEPRETETETETEDSLESIMMEKLSLTDDVVGPTNEISSLQHQQHTPVDMVVGSSSSSLNSTNANVPSLSIPPVPLHPNISEWKDVEWYEYFSSDKPSNQAKRKSFPVPFVKIACGYHRILALDEHGGLWQWHTRWRDPAKNEEYFKRENIAVKMIGAGIIQSVVLTGRHLSIYI
jgi:hypothetical protein